MSAVLADMTQADEIAACERQLASRQLALQKAQNDEWRMVRGAGADVLHRVCADHYRALEAMNLAYLALDRAKQPARAA